MTTKKAQDSITVEFVKKGGIGHFLYCLVMVSFGSNCGITFTKYLAPKSVAFQWRSLLPSLKNPDLWQQSDKEVLGKQLIRLDPKAK